MLFREPLIGLDLYKLPAVDFVLESVVVIVGENEGVLLLRRRGYCLDLDFGLRVGPGLRRSHRPSPVGSGQIPSS